MKCFSSVGLQLERTNLGKKCLCVSVWPGHPEKIIKMEAQTPLAAKDMDESIHKAIGATSRLYKSLLNADLAMMRAKRQSVWGQRGEQHFHVQNSREKGPSQSLEAFLGRQAQSFEAVSGRQIPTLRMKKKTLSHVRRADNMVKVHGLFASEAAAQIQRSSILISNGICPTT